MAHYAFIDSNNTVTQVIVGRNEGDQGIDWEQWYGFTTGNICKRTSYNTRGGKHLLNGVQFRKNYAGIGYTFDAHRDAFIPPQPFPSWVLIEETCQWDAPVAMPDDGQRYQWDETALAWVVMVQ
jgi:hypothetical protein